MYINQLDAHILVNSLCFFVKWLYILMDLQEVGSGGGDWMELAQDRVYIYRVEMRTSEGKFTGKSQKLIISGQ